MGRTSTCTEDSPLHPSKRFLMVRDNSWDDMAGTRTVVVVENFFEELRAKLKK